jgi:hypothetical protein
MSRTATVLHYVTDIGHRASEGTNYLVGGSGIVYAVLGAADANVLQAWAGALVAAVAAVWGLWRDQKRHDHQEEQRKKDTARHDAWDSFITDYRMQQILTTGKDPFALGCPPLDFIEAAEMAEINRNAPPKAEDTHVTTTEQKREPTKPKWPNLRHIFG